MEITFSSYNVNGLRTDGNIPKRRKIFTWLKSKAAEVIFLQETHSDSSVAAIWEREWGGHIIFSHGSTRSCGVAILFQPGLNMNTEHVITDEHGRFIIAKVNINNAKCLLVNIYGPNRDNPQFFEDVFLKCEDLNYEYFIAGGDFNLVLDSKIDRASSARRSVNSSRSTNVILGYMQQNDIVDVWRHMHPRKRQYTCLRHNPMSKSRIDFFLVSQNCLHQVSPPKAEIYDGYLSDHKMIEFQTTLGGNAAGKAFWRFNDAWLSDDILVDKIRQRIVEIKRENDDGEISRHTLLQTIFCVIRGDIIKYRSHKNKERREAIAEIERKINALPDDKNQAEMELFRSLSRDRESYMKEKTASNMFKCKVRWRALAEKGTKYFHSRIRNEKRCNFVSMELENTRPGQVTDKTEEMLNECGKYYSDMYTYVPNTNAETDRFFSGLPFLDETEKQMCDAPITADELEYTLKQMKGGSSPGIDGITTCFLKTFWSELKDLIMNVIDEIVQTGVIPWHLQMSVTTLIPKKGKDVRLVKNLRPISLLNTVFKLITKTLAIRLTKVINKLINSDQTGFIKGRYIGENVRLLIDDLKWTTGPIDYLGIKIGANNDNVELNYSDKIQKFRTVLSPWARCQLTPYGRVYLIKSIALSQLVYAFSVLPKPSNEMLGEIDKIMFKFIWGGKKDKIKRSVLRNNHTNGGLKVPQPSLMADSLKLSWVRKFLDSSNTGKWKKIIADKLCIFSDVHLNLFECSPSYEQMKQIKLDPFWSECITAWNNIVSREKLNGGSILWKPIWMNQEIKLESNPSISREALVQKGILRIGDLYDFTEQKIGNVEWLSRKFPGLNFLVWISLLSSIPEGWKRIISQEKPSSVRRPSSFDAMFKQTKIAAWSYRTLLYTGISNIATPERIKRKWEQELEVRAVNWNNVFNSAYKATDDFKLRWLQFRIVHRILPSNHLLQIYGIKDNSNCYRCGNIENIMHIFWSCAIVRRFWGEIGGILGFEANPKGALLGAQNEEGQLSTDSTNLSFLIARLYIWNTRSSEGLLNLIEFRKFVKSYHSVEKYTAIINDKIEKHERLWRSIVRLLEL